MSIVEIMIVREIDKLIENHLFKGKVILLTGPRQVGKTTLLRMIMNKTDKKTLFWNCDEPDVRQKLTNATSKPFRA